MSYGVPTSYLTVEVLSQEIYIMNSKELKKRIVPGQAIQLFVAMAFNSNRGWDK
jgi:hypothetical protein